MSGAVPGRRIRKTESDDIKRTRDVVFAEGYLLKKKRKQNRPCTM